MNYDMDMMKTELALYLDTLNINGKNVDQVRRSLFLPYDCSWNTLVRDMTAKRERLSPYIKRVSLGMEDVPPGSALRKGCIWHIVLVVWPGGPETNHRGVITWSELIEEGWEILRPGIERRWEPCYKKG